MNIDALRKAAAEAAGVDAPDLAKLRRVTLGSIFQAGLLLLAASAIISYFAGLDFEELRATFESASIPLLATGFVVSQIPRLTQAISTTGSVPARMPFVPVYMMQLATCFMNVALPSNAARAMLGIRFFQRQGVAPATAAVSGLVDSLMSNVVQALLLGALLLFSDTNMNLDSGGSSSPDDGKHTLLFIVAIALVVAVAVLLFSDRLRKKVVGKIHSWWPDVKAAAATLRDPRKLAELLLGNIATELLFASALAIFVHACRRRHLAGRGAVRQSGREPAGHVHPGARRDWRVGGRAGRRAHRDRRLTGCRVRGRHQLPRFHLLSSAGLGLAGDALDGEAELHLNTYTRGRSLFRFRRHARAGMR